MSESGAHLNRLIARGSGLVARLAHNQEVAGSNPALATIQRIVPAVFRGFFWLSDRLRCPRQPIPARILYADEAEYTQAGAASH